MSDDYCIIVTHVPHPYKLLSGPCLYHIFSCNILGKSSTISNDQRREQDPPGCLWRAVQTDQWSGFHTLIFTFHLFISPPSLCSTSPPGSPAVRQACCLLTGALGWVWEGKMSHYLQVLRPFLSDWCSRTALLSKPCFWDWDGHCRRWDMNTHTWTQAYRPFVTWLYTWIKTLTVTKKKNP